LKRKKEKREKEFEPPIEKPSHLKQQQQSTTDSIVLFLYLIYSIDFSFLDTSKLVKNVKKKLKRLQAD
jgi:hypothetical protein